MQQRRPIVRWILRIALAIPVLLVGALGVAWLRSTNACPASNRPTPQRAMQATFHCDFGGPEVLRQEALEIPVPTDSQVLVRVRVASVNPTDWHGMRGSPWLARSVMGWRVPAEIRFGTDFAGVVEQVGRAVTTFHAGDSVFGARTGALAQYVTVSASRLARMPSGASFEDAAAIPVAGATALEGLRDQGRVHQGSRVLVNGASGGVGSFAVQIAKAMGAHVTGVASTRNQELLRAIGVDEAIDYTTRDFTKDSVRWDVIIDNVGNHSLGETVRVLSPNGTYVMIGGPSGGLIDPLPRVAELYLRSKLTSRDLRFFVASVHKDDLEFLANLMSTGKLKPVIDRRYPFAQVREAVAYLETGRARGKVIVTIE